MQIIENLCPHYNLSFLIFQFIIFSKEKMRIKEIIETMGVCFNRLEKYNAFQIMNEWLPRQSETFQEQVKKKLTHKVEEYTEGSAEIYKKIFGNIPERFREEKDFREIEYLEKCKIEYIT